MNFLDHLNSVSDPLRFTIEEMTDNKLDFIGLRLSNDLNICIKDKDPILIKIIYSIYSYFIDGS